MVAGPNSARSHPCSMAPTLYLWFIYLIHSLLKDATAAANTVPSIGDGVPHDYCEAEDFITNCQKDQVVMMKYAKYGIMEIGRCIPSDFGMAGCESDVMGHMDVVCSGRDRCSIRVPDRELEKLNTCPSSFRVYLQAAYTCERVEMDACRQCQNKDGLNVAKLDKRSGEGYLASYSSSAENYHCGALRCPWELVVGAGQKVNFTLYDFGWSWPATSGLTCVRYATIKIAGQPDFPVCRKSQRITHLLMTNGKDTEMVITVVSHNVFEDKGHFLIKYKIIGCEDIQKPEYGWVKYESNTRAKVGCHSTTQQWVFYCLNNTWTGSSILDVYCPEGQIDSRNTLTLPLGVLIAIIVGIALVIGVLILTIGLVCLKSRHQTNVPGREEMSIYMRHRRPSDYPGEESASTPLRYVKNPSPEPKRSSTSSATANIRENVYMERRPLPSIPNVDDGEDDNKSTKVQVYRTSSGREHYHNPRLVVHTRSEPPRPPMMGVYTRGGSHRGHGGDTSAGAGPGPGPGAVGPGAVGPACLAFGPGEDPQYFVLDPDELKTGEAACSASAPSGAPSRPGRGGVRSDKQKSPEEENAENFCKEVAHNLNNSCHEIPSGSQVAGGECSKQHQQQGNSSWP